MGHGLIAVLQPSNRASRGVRSPFCAVFSWAYWSLFDLFDRSVSHGTTVASRRRRVPGWTRLSRLWGTLAEGNVMAIGFETEVDRRWLLRGVVLLGAFGAMNGCSRAPERLPVVPVQGVVIFQDQPLANALVTFHPAEGSDPKAVSGRATSGADGTFALSTHDANDGASVGKYRVTVECYQIRGEGSQWEPGPNILPPLYANPSTTPIEVSVTKEDSSVHRIEVK